MRVVRGDLPLPVCWVVPECLVVEDQGGALVFVQLGFSFGVPASAFRLQPEAVCPLRLRGEIDPDWDATFAPEERDELVQVEPVALDSDLVGEEAEKRIVGANIVGTVQEGAETDFLDGYEPIALISRERPPR